MITKPLLASAVADINKLKFPVSCTEKLDGIRCLKIDGEIVTRNFKPFPNVFINKTLQSILPDGIDGEILVPGKTFNEIQSLCMTQDGSPAFKFFAFDYVKDNLEKPYLERMDDMYSWYHKQKTAAKNSINNFVMMLAPLTIHNVQELEEYESICLSKGYEGVMIRDPNGRYKCGRSSAREGILLKMKRFIDAEATVIGFEEKMHNDNEATKDAFGRTKRSSHKANMVAAGTLGALIVIDCKTLLEFKIGTGLDDELREEIWSHQKKYLSKLVTYKSQPHGAKEKPRFPVFKGFRSKLDI
jgi:DNA ligase 1